VLPLFLARHLWHAWKAVEREVAGASPVGSTIRGRTKERWRARLASSARVLVVLLAMGGSAALEGVVKQVGLSGTRAELVASYAAVTASPVGERLSSLGAIVHRLERGVRLM
jgi:hypothetical protein